MSLRVTHAELFFADLRTRIPFRYGIATMTDVRHLFMRVTIETSSGEFTGVSADVLAPKWFTKDPARALEDEVAEMMDVIRSAGAAAIGRSAASPFALWRELYEEQMRAGARRGWPPLLAHFGVTLVERAVIEAWARHAGRSFAALLRGGGLGFEPSVIHAGLAGIRIGELLPATPAGSVVARHTVGLSDPLAEGDIAGGERVNDGLPESLEAAIREHRLRHFKVKVAGGGAASRERLRRVLETIRAGVKADFEFSVDCNEGFLSAGEFRDFWKSIESEPWWTRDAHRLLWVEQPMHRSVALDDSTRAVLTNWAGRPRLIIDESDSDVGSLPRALEAGYHGTSHKNCKGVFKGAANACLISMRRAGGESAVMSGEDLTNIGPVALLQDLAVQTALGIQSVERNGHHYFRGLSFWPESVQEAMTRNHPDLYAPTGMGWPALTIREGRISTESVNAAPFGRIGELDLSSLSSEEIVKGPMRADQGL